MLWDAGQGRIARERTGRLREGWMTTRDAIISAEVAIGRATAHGSATPGYARDERPPATAESQQATLGRLAAMFPGAIVRRGDS